MLDHRQTIIPRELVINKLTNVLGKLAQTLPMDWRTYMVLMLTANQKFLVM